MKLYFNMGLRMYLYKIRHIDRTTTDRKGEHYRQFIIDFAYAVKKAQNQLLEDLGKTPVDLSYKRFRIKKL